MKSLVKLAEDGFVFVTILAATNAFESIEPWGSLLRRVWYLINPFTLLIVILRWKQILRVAARDKFILTLVGIAIISVLWSEVPGETIHESYELVCTTLFAYYLAYRCKNVQGLLKMLALPLGFAALTSLFYAVAMPSVGVMQANQAGGNHTGSWKGVFVQKNIMARAISVAVIVFLCHDRTNRKYSQICWFLFAISVILVKFSRSGTGFITVIALIGLFPLYKALRWNFVLILPICLMGLLLGASSTVWLVDNAAEAAASIGKDLTFSGRDKLWEAVFDKIWERPFLGWGYGAFWSWESGGAHVWRSLGWDPPHAHNGVVQVWAILGLLGLSVFLMGYISTYIRALNWARMTKTPAGIWALEYLTFMFIFNVSQDLTPEGKSIFWIIYVATSVLIGIPSEQESAIDPRQSNQKSLSERKVPDRFNKRYLKN
ncbi:O-antigen ligase family protein [Aerosakkonema funiforme]|uniref:O-antigen ligase family protein n=1 Tax=Aerosakkonema funiforme TaxID=1246630 RepID=UPI0035B868F7